MLALLQMGHARRKKKISRRKSSNDVIHSSAETVFSVAVVKEGLQECYTEL